MGVTLTPERAAGQSVAVGSSAGPAWPWAATSPPKTTHGPGHCAESGNPAGARSRGALVQGEPVITVLTSQPVVASEVERLLTVQPAASYTVEALESGFKLKGQLRC
ncbi:MAG: hypothetical protein WKG07_27550 [Hymenobacter sp.]